MIFRILLSFIPIYIEGDSTTTPEQCPIIPQHRIDLRDTYYTLDGSDLSDECVVAYSGQLNERASAVSCLYKHVGKSELFICKRSIVSWVADIRM